MTNVPEESWKGAPDLEPLLVEIDDLILDPENDRDHSDPRGLDVLEYSLRRFGQMSTVTLAHDGKTVLKGNGLVQVARDRLKWTFIAAARSPHESAVVERGYAIVDNRSAELSSWDSRNLGPHLRALEADGWQLPKLGWGDEDRRDTESDWEPPSRDASEKSDEKPKSVVFPPELWPTILRAIEKARKDGADPDMKPPRALELICAEYLG